MSSSNEVPQFVAPNTCAHCRHIKSAHGMCWSRELNALHYYVAPSNELRLQRMKANRALGLTHVSPYKNYS